MHTVAVISTELFSLQSLIFYIEVWVAWVT